MSQLVTILTFHALDDARTVTSFAPTLFERMVRILRASALPVISLADAMLGLRGEVALPERSVVITFDDGYRSVYEVAFPILREHRRPATVFWTGGRAEGDQSRGGSGPGTRLPSMDGRVMLTWVEIQEMHRSGMDFGAHTLRDIFQFKRHVASSPQRCSAGAL